ARPRLDVENRARRPEVDDLGRPDPAARTPGVVNGPAGGEGRSLCLDRGELGLATEMVAGGVDVAVALGGRVENEHHALRATGELLGGLFLGEIEAPVPGRDRDAGTETVEPGAADLGAVAVKDRRG